MLGRKVIYVRCISCTYNNVAKSIRLLDKKAILVYTGKFSCKLELLKDISPENENETPLPTDQKAPYKSAQ